MLILSNIRIWGGSLKLGLMQESLFSYNSQIMIIAVDKFIYDSDTLPASFTGQL